MNVYREAYANNFLTSVSFWGDWLAQECTIGLFEKALSHCPHFELAIKYIEFALLQVEGDKLVRHCLLYVYDLDTVLNSILLFRRAAISEPSWSA